jgi:hypothetical protein
MRLAANSRFFFFVGWVAWWAASWALIYAAYTLRARDWLTPYGVEAWLAMVAPLAVFAAADHLVMKLYERIWFAFTSQSLGPVVLEREAVDRLRADLRRNLLLRWAAPPVSRSMGAQLMTAALWLPAIAAPDDTPPLVRYREWIFDSVSFLFLGAGGLLAVLWPTREGIAIALAVLSAGLGVLGFSLIRLAARRQAILDYFNAWRSMDEAG